jgi:hypothetical protein
LFKSGIGGRISLKLDEAEKQVLSQIFEQMDDLLQAPNFDKNADPLARMLNMDGSTQISEDPALARLFPDGYSKDEHASADFRRFTEQDLRQAKMDALNDVRLMLMDISGKSAVTPNQAQSWLKAINDVRLVLGTRLEITDEREIDFDEDEPGIHLYNYLTYLQGTLLDALS